MLNPDIKAYLKDHREEHLSTLCEMLRFASISAVNDPDGCRPCAEWIAEHLRRLGLTAEVLPTDGQPCVFGELHVSDDAPTLLIYCHYDVQPPDPLDEWITPPFDPRVRDGWLYARGASDDKGQLMMHLAAIDAYRKTGGGVPINLKLLVEGEEEVGSPNIEPFLVKHKDRLQADALVISDVGFFADGCPSIMYALRGLCAFDVTYHGPNRDVHSGLEGGVITNPLNALARLTAAFHNDDGSVAIPGFYDDVIPVSEAERESWNSLPHDDEARAKSLGLEHLAGGERGYHTLERNWVRPTLECNGLSGGYAGPGAKTVIPAKATGKFSLRLVANQDPDKIQAAIDTFIHERTPKGIRAEITVHASNRPVRLPTDTPAMRAGKAAMAEAFGAEPKLICCGASIPITEILQRLLGLDAVMLGITLPEDNLHSPNERLKLTQLYQGAEMAASFYDNLRVLK
ncbi:MAG: dipeptidase [Phycisphaerae bacterium]|nr:dipeptidase [Phycisphaerae bacterium]